MRANRSNPLCTASPRRGWLLCILLLAACAGDAGSTAAATDPSVPSALGGASSARAGAAAPADKLGAPALSTGSTSAPGAAPAPAPGDFRELLGADWELAPGSEQYICVRYTVPETVYVNAWHAQAPVGTHHVVMTASAQPDGEPDGESVCDVATLGTQNIYGAGVGAAERHLPPGIAIKLAQASQLLLNLHLFNASDKPLRGRSGAAIQSMDEKDVRVLADGVLAGPIKLAVPPGRSTIQGKCTFDRDATILSIMPHMHQMGVAMKVVAHTALAGDVVLFDAAYSFDNQLTYPLGMLQLKTGDVVEVACTYENTTGRTLHWGGSSNDEMCNAGLARIPAGGPSVCAM